MSEAPAGQVEVLRERSAVADLIIRFRWLALGVLAALMVALASSVVPLQYDFSFTSLFVGKGPAYDDLGDYLERFGADVNVVAVAVQSEVLYSDDGMRDLGDLVDALASVEGVASVTSPVDVEDLVGDGGQLRSEPIVPPPGERNTDWDAVRRRATSHPLWGGSVFGADGRHAAVIVEFGREHSGDACGNGVDDDGDGGIDCEDLPCRENEPLCTVSAGSETAGPACSNGLDDDGDGAVDCDDDGCAAFAGCLWRQSTESSRGACGNGVDDDGDGLVDCEDSDCIRHPDIPDCHATEAVIARVEAFKRDHPTFDAWLGGVPYVSGIYTDVIRHDLVTFVPLTGLLTALILLVIFGSARGVLLPSVTVALAVIAALGAMMATGGKLNIINSSMPTLLLVIAVADGVHILSRYLEEAAVAQTPREAASRTMAHMTGACALTSITSAVGFASLLTAQLPIIRSFGIYSGLGILLAYLVTMLLVPPVLSLMPLPRGREQERSRSEQSLSARLARWTTDHAVMLVWEHRRACGVAMLVGLVVCLVGVSRVEQNSHLLAELADDHPASEANRVIEAHLGGVLSGAVMVYGEPGDMARPEVLGALDQIGAFAEAWRWEDGRPLVSQAISLAPIVKEAHADFLGDPTARTIPTTRAGVVALLDQVPAERRAELTSADYAVTHLTFRMYDVGSAAWSALREGLEAEIARELAPLGTFRVVFTGSSTLGQDAMGFMTRDLVTSLFLAVVIIMVLMTVLFRSLWLGVLSMVPNLLPLLVTLATVGYLGIDMRVSTAVVFSVSLGIAVDDTIHLLVRFREELRRTPSDYEGALRRAMHHSGRAILFTTAILCVGFGVLSASEFTAVRELGLLGAVTLFSAVVGDLLVLPWVLLTVRPKQMGARSSNA